MMTSPLRMLLGGIVALTLAACGGGGGSGGPPAPVNQAPVADAGPDQQGLSGESLEIVGDARDADGTIASVMWEQTGGPDFGFTTVTSDTLSLDLPDLPCPTDLRFRFTVMDDDNATGADNVTISVLPDNAGFTVSAGADRTLIRGNAIDLAASTTLADCNHETVAWQQTSGPATEYAAEGLTLNVTASRIGDNDTAVFEVTITDHSGVTASDDATVQISTPSEIPIRRVVRRDDMMLTATDDRLFARIEAALLEIDGISGDSRTVTGNVIVTDLSGGQTDSIYLLKQIWHEPSSDRVYLAQQQLNVVDANPADGKVGVDMLLPQSEVEGCCNGFSFGLTEDDIYYTQYQRDETEVYRQSRTDSSSRELFVTVPGEQYSVLTDATALYLYRDRSGNATFLAIDLESRNVSTILDLADRQVVAAVPAETERFIYWQVDGVLYEIERSTHQVRTVATDRPFTTELVAHGGFIYSVVAQAFGDVDVFRTEIQTGATDILLALESARALAFIDDVPYITTHQGILPVVNIYQAENWVPTLAATMEVFPVDTNNAGLSMITSDTRIVLAGGGKKLALIDIAGAEPVSIGTPSETEYLIRDQTGFAFGGGSPQGGLQWISDAGPVRELERLYDGGESSQTDSLVVEQDTVFWISKAQPTPGAQREYRISSVGADGTGHAVLFQGSTKRLRDLGLYDGNLFFACEDDCGATGWVLATIPVSGGAPRLLTEFEHEPRLVFLNDRVYIVAAERRSSTIRVYHLGLEQMAELPIAPLWGIRLAVREDAIYVGTETQLDRYEVIDWDTVGPGQSIPVSQSAYPNNFDVDSMTLSDTALYYRDVTLKRIADPAP